MGQLGQWQQPVSADNPGIREVLAGQRVGLDRGADRARRESAELRAYDGSGGVGGKAYATDLERITQQQGEAEAQFRGQVLHSELQQRRQALLQALGMAMNSGDAAAAQAIQNQLGAIQSQMQQGQFQDQQAFNYNQLNANNNLQTLLALLNAA